MLCLPVLDRKLNPSPHFDGLGSCLSPGQIQPVCDLLEQFGKSGTQVRSGGWGPKLYVGTSIGQHKVAMKSLKWLERPPVSVGNNFGGGVSCMKGGRGPREPISRPG